MADLQKIHVVYNVTLYRVWAGKSFCCLVHYSHGRPIVVWCMGLIHFNMGWTGYWVHTPHVHMTVGWVRSGQLFGGLGRWK